MKIKLTPNYNKGNAINRVYKRCRLSRNCNAALAAGDFGIASLMATMHQAIPTVMLGAVTCMIIHQTNKCNKLLKALQPFYDEIATRAQRIYSKK